MKFIKTLDNAYINLEKVLIFEVIQREEGKGHPFLVVGVINGEEFVLRQFSSEGSAHQWIKRRILELSPSASD